VRRFRSLTPVICLLLLHCGSKQDLVLGEVPRGGAAGENVIPSAGTAAEPGSGGVAAAGTSSAGSATEGGRNEGGTSGDGGASGAAAEGGAGGDSSTEPTCVEGEEPPVGSLVHRYDFSGTGTVLQDLAGTADGAIMEGAKLDGSGVLSLPGRVNDSSGNQAQPDQYVDLPNGIVSQLSDVTFVVWTSWLGGAGFQRLFDFGDSTAGEGQGDRGRNYIAVLYGSNFANGDQLGSEIAAPSTPTLSLGSYFKLTKGQEFQVALSYQSKQRVALYAEAQELIASPVQRSLSELNDVNCWLGRSQWLKDHGYRGTYNEFRIYNVALNSCQLATLKARGPDLP